LGVDAPADWRGPEVITAKIEVCSGSVKARAWTTHGKAVHLWSLGQRMHARDLRRRSSKSGQRGSAEIKRSVSPAKEGRGSLTDDATPYNSISHVSVGCICTLR